jgi:hypothetical protein
MSNPITGRDTIALKAEGIEVELNVVNTFDHSYPAEITKHAIEKDGSKQTISDHVALGDRAITIAFVLSSSTELFALTRMTVDSKIKQLIEWQSNGQIVTLLGYGTGGILDKIISKLPSIFQYLEPDDVMERFVGRSRDEIPNLLLGDITFNESTEFGQDIGGTMMIWPVLIAEAKTRAVAEKSVPSAGKVKPKKEELPKEPSPKKTLLKSVIGL